MGIPDLYFLFFTDVIFSVLSMIFFSIPIFSYFAKVTPAKIEATIYAFLTGTTDLSGGVIAPLWGSFINRQFVGVTKDDMSGYSTLILIAFIGSIIFFVAIFLIPTKKQVK